MLNQKVTLSPCQKNVTDSPLKTIKNGLNFILKTHSVLKMFKFLSWLFDHVEKMAWLERFPNSWHHNLFNKQLQYTYFPISREVKATRQWKNFLNDFYSFFKFTHKKNKINIYNIWNKHNITVWSYLIQELDNNYTLKVH